MDCRDIVPFLSPYIDGELSSRDTQAVTEHKRTCVSCESRHAQLLAVRDAVRQWPEDIPSATLGAKLAARLAPAVESPAARGGGYRRLLGLGAAGLALAGVVALLVLPDVRTAPRTILRPDRAVTAGEMPAIDCGRANAVRCQSELLCATVLSCGLPRAMPALVTEQ